MGKIVRKATIYIKFDPDSMSESDIDEIIADTMVKNDCEVIESLEFVNDGLYAELEEHDILPEKRKANGGRNCPKCHKVYWGKSAISRDEARTEICPKCAVIEALDKANINDEGIRKEILEKTINPVADGSVDALIKSNIRYFIENDPLMENDASLEIRWEGFKLWTIQNIKEEFGIDGSQIIEKYKKEFEEAAV